MTLLKPVAGKGNKVGLVSVGSLASLHTDTGGGDLSGVPFPIVCSELTDLF